MKVVIVGDIQGGNYYHAGDEAMFSSVVAYIREIDPSAEIVAASKNPPFTARTHGIRAVRRAYYPHRKVKNTALYISILLNVFLRKTIGRTVSIWRLPLPAIVEEIASADYVVFTGGGNLHNYGGSDFLANVLFYMFLPVLFRKPILIFSQTVGPFRTNSLIGKATAKLTGVVLNSPSVKFISVRDRLFSANMLHAIGVRRPIITFAPDDAVFLKRATLSEVRRILSASGLSKLDAFIVVSIKESDAYRYGALLAKGLDSVIEKLGIDLLFIPHVYPGHDVEAMRAIRSGMDYRQKVYVIDHPCLDYEIKGLTAKAELVIASRYHGAVFALSEGVPTVALYDDYYYEVKMRGIMELYGCDDWVLDLESISSEELAETIIRCWSSRLAIRNALATAIAEVGRMSSNKNTLASFLGRSHSALSLTW